MLLQILLFSQRIINPPEFSIIAQPKSTAKALNDEAGSQLMVGVSNPHTSRPAEPDASSQRLPSANAHSSTAGEIIAKIHAILANFFYKAICKITTFAIDCLFFKSLKIEFFKQNEYR